MQSHPFYRQGYLHLVKLLCNFLPNSKWYSSGWLLHRGESAVSMCTTLSIENALWWSINNLCSSVQQLTWGSIQLEYQKLPLSFFSICLTSAALRQFNISDCTFTIIWSINSIYLGYDLGQCCWIWDGQSQCHLAAVAIRGPPAIIILAGFFPV